MYDFKITDHKYQFSILKIIVFLEDLLSQTTKQPLSNFDPKKTRKFKQTLGLRPDLSFKINRKLRVHHFLNNFEITGKISIGLYLLMSLLDPF